MVKADVLFLIGQTPEAHGVFEEYIESKRQVFCTVRSVGMTEKYEAMSKGLDLQYVFALSDYAEYAGEKVVEYNGERYSVIRTYEAGQKIEITVAKG